MIPPGIAVLCQFIQLSPAVSSLVSASRFQHHVFLGHPLFLFPSGSRLRNAVDWLVESVTNPSPAVLSNILFHWHLTCTLRCHSCSLLMVSGRQIPRVLLGQLLTKVCILYVMVTVVLAWPACPWQGCKIWLSSVAEMFNSILNADILCISQHIINKVSVLKITSFAML